jgi:cation transport ATPase
MKSFMSTLSCVALGLALSAGSAQAEVKVKISKMHICCKGCTVAIQKAVAKMPEVTITVDQEKGTTELAAEKPESVQKALDAIAKAGFHGVSDNKELKFKEEKLPEGKVQRLEVFSVHNCCPACTKAIKGAVAKVEGVKGDTCENKKESFVVEGDFVAKDLIAAINKAGFNASLTKPKEEPQS